MIATTYDQLLDACAYAPEDWDRYLVAADCAEEEGRDMIAEALRWLARERKRARRISAWLLWYEQDTECGYDPESDLPTPLYDDLIGRRGEDDAYVEYESSLAALTAVIVAYGKARAAGWSPEGGGNA